jgi:aspartyl/asparaginyl-tRNA synthetase
MMKALFRLNARNILFSNRLFSSAAKSIKRTKIRAVIDKDIQCVGDHIKVQGWIKSVRNQKSLTFIELYDGSCSQSIQAVVDNEVNSADTSRFLFCILSWYS